MLLFPFLTFTEVEIKISDTNINQNIDNIQINDTISKNNRSYFY